MCLVFKQYLGEGFMDDQFEDIETIETTIGDLIATITEIALEAGKSEEEGYELAALAIESILRRNRREQPVVLN